MGKGKHLTVGGSDVSGGKEQTPEILVCMHLAPSIRQDAAPCIDFFLCVCARVSGIIAINTLHLSQTVCFSLVSDIQSFTLASRSLLSSVTLNIAEKLSRVKANKATLFGKFSDELSREDKV